MLLGRTSPRFTSPSLPPIPCVPVPIAMLVFLLMIMMLLPIMMQRHTIELLERIRDLRPGSRQAGVQGDAFDVARAGTHVHARALFDVAEVDCVGGPALMGNHGRLHVSEQSPLGGAEEGVRFDVGGAGSGAEASCFVFDEEFADDGFAEAVLFSLAG